MNSSRHRADGAIHRDNSRYLMVRLNDEQYALLNKYREMTNYGQTLYFRKLINGERITVSCHKSGVKPFAALNKIYSNISQITRNEAARILDADSVKMLEFLCVKLKDEIEAIATDGKMRKRAHREKKKCESVSENKILKMVTTCRIRLVCGSFFTMSSEGAIPEKWLPKGNFKKAARGGYAQGSFVTVSSEGTLAE